jgi:hypothetical protein
MSSEESGSSESSERGTKRKSQDEEEDSALDDDALNEDDLPEDSSSSSDLPQSEVLEPDDDDDEELSEEKPALHNVPPPKKQRISPPPSDSPGNGLYKLDCPFCGGDLRYPVVSCKTPKCTYTICEEDLQQWTKSKNGMTKPVACPICTLTNGFEENRGLNSIIGQVTIPCANQAEGCDKQIARSDLDAHLNKYCDFQVIPCPQRKDGCTWRGQRKQLTTHVASCRFEEVAAQQAKINEKQRLLEQKMADYKADLKKDKLDFTMAQERCSAKMAADMLRVRTLGETMNETIGHRYMKSRQTDSDSIPVRNITTSSLVQMELHIVMLDAEPTQQPFYQVYASFAKGQQHFPIFINGYFQTFDQTVPSARANAPFNYRFRTLRERALIFDERVAFTGVPSNQREQHLNFRIVCVMQN